LCRRRAPSCKVVVGLERFAFGTDMDRMKAVSTSTCGRRHALAMVTRMPEPVMLERIKTAVLKAASTSRVMLFVVTKLSVGMALMYSGVQLFMKKKEREAERVARR